MDETLKAILVYTISDDDLRKEFVEAMLSRGWENHKDQSTLILPRQSSLLILNIDGFIDWFENWSKDKEWCSKDFVHLFYPVLITEGDITIPVLKTIEFHKV